MSGIPPKKKKNNKWVALVNIPVQMGATIYLCFLFGGWLDRKFPDCAVDFSKVLGMFGVVSSIYLVIKEVNKLNQNE